MNEKNFTPRKILEIALYSMFTIYFGILAFYTPGYGAKARLFPVIVLVISAVLLTLKFLTIFSAKCAAIIEPKIKKDHSQLVSGAVDIEPTEADTAVNPIDNARASRSVVAMMLWLVATAALLYAVGIIPAIAISMLVFFVFFTGMKWYYAIIFDVSFAAAVYVIFQLLLKIRLYEGIFF